MKRPILLHPDPRLKKVCAPVPDLTDELRALASDMLETMYDAPGIGLAAPQVGVMSRLIVLDCVKEEGATPRPLVMFNPKVIEAITGSHRISECPARRPSPRITRQLARL